MIIQRIHECLKAKKKSHPESLLSILNSLNEQNQSLQISLTQKGVVLEILTKFCLTEHQLLSKTLIDFKDGLYGGRFDPIEKTTKKRRTNEGRETNTTTRKKKLEAIEQPRNEINLDQLLERELSSPNNTEPKSQISEESSKIKQPLDFISMDRLEEPFNRCQDFVTPIKEIKVEEENKLDEYRDIINISDKNITKMKTKARNQQTAASRTRKKNLTQPLPEEINTNISLEMLSQLSIKKEIEDILEITKKKKNKDKENLYHHEVFQISMDTDNEHIFENRHTISKFNEDFTIKQSKEKFFMTQTNPYSSLFEEFEKEADETIGGLKFEGRKEELDKLVEEELGHAKKVRFNKFSDSLQISQSDKSILFYSMLCRCDYYKMEQHEIKNFGEIIISLC